MALPGDEFGHYRLVRLLGAGGMGEVYLARDLSLGRDVAIKVLSSATSTDREARHRLLREAQAVAQLDHPNICQVFDVGETPDGQAFIAMSYLEGDTLAARLSAGALPVHAALILARDIADALSAAHARGIIHRDLKPQNIMISPSGRPRLLDFGVAKRLAPGGLSSAATTDGGVTAAGAIVGSPAYMSPEQVAGQPVDGRSDLFSLGAVLYECLAGRRAFVGASVLSVVAAVLHEDPPRVSTLRPGTPTDVDALCARMLAKDPGERFQTTDEVLGAIRLLLPVLSRPGAPGPETPSPGAGRLWSWRGALAGLLVMAVAISVGAWMYQSRRQLPQPSPAAERWYRRGTEFIREGAYHSASAALGQAIRQFPDYPLAYARHAEALAELDDQQHASQQLLRMQSVLGDESRLSEADQLRVQGIRALVLRDLPRAVEAYRALVGRTPDDPGAWVDLGRAHEAAEQRTESRASYERALTLDAGLAVAHLRKASIDSQAGRRERALQSFGEAERLYRAASNAEGETEVLLRRGAFLEARGELAPARRDLERARSLASDSGATAQFIRARLALGSVAVTEGKVAVAERLLGDATDDARRAELWSLVADGLIELGGALVNQPDKLEEADSHVKEAFRLASQRGAQRTAARATLQLASLALQRDEPVLARDLASGTLEFLRAKNYRRLELLALTVVGRAYRDLDDPDRAQTTAFEVLRAAQELGDEAQAALALTNLAGAATARGDLPAALDARTRAEVINRTIGNEGALPYSLTNRAELLIRLGRAAEAESLLVEVDAGIGRGIVTYKGRARRASYLRALSAIAKGQRTEAARHARAAIAGATTADATATLADALLKYATAVPARTPAPAAGAAETVTGQGETARELHYWRALDAHARGDHRRALTISTRGLALTTRVSNDELAWRLAAVASRCAATLGEPEVSGRMKQAAVDARRRMQVRWQSAFPQYEARADLAALWQGL